MSPRSRLYKTEAIVLRAMNLGEADRVLTVLTPRLGKLKVIAKGVRRP
ncbi:MAG TPA: recombination protein O N-terminal domain-containing protein, partial [Candidatus Limnocylindria bacterium]|nr:recombination protein O N-terminal domain-containing protein [Candidatus Limnocylindria bacterium]